ncbi:MFS transporter [Kineococcus gynurae]|uniref:MFS transporter n=1 Tax=Kineococcus gynurae TaxID=452979 RepID=A0ABV5LRR2_9ACTN
MTSRRSDRPGGRAAFLAAALAFVLIFVAAGTPIPLYNTYRREDGLSTGDLTVATAAYLMAAATSLLVLGRASDHLGRRPVGIAALLSSAAGLVVLLGVDGLAPLVVGRSLQGLATGLSAGALGALAVDSAPPRPRWLPAVVTSAAPMLGIPAGALVSGVLVDTGPAPRHLVYGLVIGLLLLAAVAVARVPETVPHPDPRRLAGSLHPQVRVPDGARRPMLAMSGLILATWSLGGFYQAFGPTIAADQLGSTAASASAAVFGSFTVLSILGGPLSARWSPLTTLRLGAIVYAVCVAGILLALGRGGIGPFLAVSLVTGVVQGAAVSAGMRLLLQATPAADRAGLLATVFLVNYASAALPSLVAGRLTTTFSVERIADGYGVLVVVGVAVAVLASRRR